MTNPSPTDSNALGVQPPSTLRRWVVISLLINAIFAVALISLTSAGYSHSPDHRLAMRAEVIRDLAATNWRAEGCPSAAGYHDPGPLRPRV